MKLATWNCSRKFETNLPLLLDLGVDVAVVCESDAPAEWPSTTDGRAVTGLSRRVQPGSWLEVAVVACEPWSVEPHESTGSAPGWALPVRVDGPVPFTMVGVCTVPGTPTYVAQVDRTVDWIEARCAGESVVLAGDLNAPISTSRRQYEAVERRLAGRGLVDALTMSHDPGEPTYFHHRRRSEPFQIDHLFVPGAWVDGIEVSVGDFDTWVGSGRSDHVPVVVAVRAAATPG